MRNINYPLIFSDFDGTLLRSDDTLSATTKETITNYVKDGGGFVLSSGRMTPSILQRARQLSLSGLLASYNGAEIVDIGTGKRIFQGCLPKEDALEICRVLERLGLHFHVYDGDDFYSNTAGKLLTIYETVCQVKGKLVTDFPLSQFIRQQDMQVVKIAALTSPETREEVYAVLEREFGDKYLVLRSAKYLIELCDKRYSKGTALRFIAEKYGVPLEKTIAVGDNQNDLSMLQTAGKGFAVANAEESLRGEVEFFPLTNDENAVEEIIKKYGYSEENNG